LIYIATFGRTQECPADHEVGMLHELPTSVLWRRPIIKLEVTPQTWLAMVLPYMDPAETSTGNAIFIYLDRPTTALTITECTDLLQIGHNKLYRHAQSGKFPTFQVAGMVRVDPAAHIRATSKVEPIDRRNRRAA
jgi:hypothetical protein